jgi:CheY-like chemotaxis protein
MRSTSILVLGDGSLWLDLIAESLKSRGCFVYLTNAAEENLEELARVFDLVILKLPKGGSHRLAMLKGLGRETKLIILSEEMKLPVEAYQLAVADYIFLPCRLRELQRRIFLVLPGLKNRPPSLWRQLNPCNRRRFNKLVIMLQESVARLQSPAANMPDASQPGKERGDESLDNVYPKTWYSLEMVAITKGYINCLQRIKSLSVAKRQKQQKIVLNKIRSSLFRIKCLY